MFVDHVTIFVKAGDGGNGAVAFHREKYVSAGGPDGGDGGHGGNVVFRVDPGCNTLLAFRYKHKFIAARGGDGKGAKFHGATAEDLVILVPPGTLIRDSATEKILHDIRDGGGREVELSANLGDCLCLVLQTTQHKMLVVFSYIRGRQTFFMDDTAQNNSLVSLFSLLYHKRK